jgi:hypothetical protein
VVHAHRVRAQGQRVRLPANLQLPDRAPCRVADAEQPPALALKLCAPNIKMPISSTKELEQSVDNFLSNDDKIRNLRKQINGLVSERNRYQDQIISHLQQTNANTIQIENTVLRKNKTENKSAITYDLFKQVIYDEVADPVLITKIIMNMDSKRKVKSYMNIKREFRPEQP